ncbi:hypothetical protein [Streptomyces sp. NBC_01708]|uniref:hypothetical protein n=1 Tax=Streptomyces sp. NBC_01708 TaxID=2975915 RepID=UPI002E31C6EE|nr:hypothetical protein [Streptomyces sp. NBC_01708]
MTFDDIRDHASSEHHISAACDQLVSGAAVMDLQGGMIRAKGSDYEEFRLDVDELPGSCTALDDEPAVQGPSPRARGAEVL